MKKILVCTLLALAVLSGCKKATYLDSDVKDLTASISGQTDTILLHSDVNDFKLESVPDWAIAELNDSVLIVKVGKNDAGARRKGEIVVTNGDLRLAIPLLQQFNATHLTLPEGEEVRIGKEGGSKTLAVDCDGDVKIEGAEGFDATYKNGQLTITAPQNEGASIKKTLSLTSGPFMQKVEVVIEGTVCARCNGKGTVKCPKCNGNGFIFAYNEDCHKSCSNCGGSGFVCPGPNGWDGKKGKGRITCPDCHGQGK